MTSENQFDIHPSAVVCTDAILIGQVKIGANTVVHPKATLDATSGPLVIGENNIIEEKVVLKGSGPVEIGSGNSFRVGTVCHAKRVVDKNIFEMKCYIAPGVTINNECTIGPKCRVEGEQEVPDRAILLVGHVPYQMNHGSNNNTTQVDLLLKNLPNYHKTIKSSK